MSFCSALFVGYAEEHDVRIKRGKYPECLKRIAEHVRNQLNEIPYPRFAKHNIVIKIFAVIKLDWFEKKTLKKTHADPFLKGGYV